MEIVEFFYIFPPDQEYLELLATLGINVALFLRYVDDCNEVVKKVKKSVRYDTVSKTLIDDQSDSPEDDLKSDEDMMKMMRDM